MDPHHDEHDHPLDAHLRRALQPDPRVTSRVAAAALEEPGRTRWRGRLVLVPALMVLVLLSSLLLRRGSEPAKVVTVQASAAVPAQTSIRNVGTVITVARPDGQILAIVAGGTP